MFAMEVFLLIDIIILGIDERERKIIFSYVNSIRNRYEKRK